MITIDLDSTVSPKVSARADQLAATASSVQFGYIDDAHLVEVARPGDAHLLWRIDVAFGYGRETRRVELSGGIHPDAQPLLSGTGTGYCPCTAHTYRNVCAHLVAAYRRAMLDHQPELELVAS